MINAGANIHPNKLRDTEAEGLRTEPAPADDESTDCCVNASFFSISSISVLSSSFTGFNATVTFMIFPWNSLSHACRVIFGNWSAIIHSNIGTFIGGKDTALRLVDSSFAHLLVVDEECSRTTLAYSAAIVGKLKTDGGLACDDSLRSSHSVALQAEIVIGIGGLAILEVKAPSTESASLCKKYAIRFSIRQHGAV